MEILNVRNSHEKEKMLSLCINLWEKQSLIPVIGSGFSFGTPTDNGGTIPSVQDLQNQLLSYIRLFSNYDEEDIRSIESQGLSELSRIFWDIYDRIPEEEKKRFYEYISCNFLNISCQKNFQKDFLRIHWPCIFTLNYDSLIEDSGNSYCCVIPYNKINRFYHNEKVKLFKLHGDAKKYTETGDKKYFILSQDQYVDSLMSEENADMRNELLTAFSSQSILFFGCGLEDELDLLYSAQLGLAEKTRNINKELQSIIYISFESDGKTSLPLSRRKIDALTRYGITTVFRFFSDADSESFFSDLLHRIKSVPFQNEAFLLGRYSALRYNIMPENDINCRDFLFHDTLVWNRINDHVIDLPGFFVERAELHNAVDYVLSGNPICFISGNFFSGKTFFLLSVARHFPQKKTYIFPSGTKLSNLQLDFLLEQDNALLCFDTRSITTLQAKNMARDSTLREMTKRHINAIICIDRSDEPMYKYIFEARNCDKEFKLIPVNSKFDLAESSNFNRKIGLLSLPPYNRKDTILDYVVNNEKRLLGTGDYVQHFLEPQKGFFEKNEKKKIKALIMLATEIRISAKRAIQFGVDVAIDEIIKLCSAPNKSSVIERDYSHYNGDSSGFEYVCNSKYWAIRTLSTFAKSYSNSIDVISDAYLEIIRVYRAVYKDDDVLFYQSCEPYYYFDHIQVLFNPHWFMNSSKLMNAIYDDLIKELSNSYQFLHQKAKGKLIIAQTQHKGSHLSAAKKTLTEAVYNITRAIELAKEYPEAKNIDETLLHMQYTAGRIFVEFACISKRYIPEAVDECYDLYQMQKSYQQDVYDFAKSVGSDKLAFEKFKSILINDTTIKNFRDLDNNKVSFLLSHWSGKSVIYSK